MYSIKDFLYCRLHSTWKNLGLEFDYYCVSKKGVISFSEETKILID